MKSTRRFARHLLWSAVIAASAAWSFPVAGADAYVAFSLQQAQTRLQHAGDLPPEVGELGGITDPLAVVYDRSSHDLILVGKANPTQQVVALNDFVVALRAILKHQTWPLVSIDKDENTAQTKKQRVRFEGGICDSAFGNDLLQANVVLKKLGLGDLSAGVWGVQSYFEMLCERAATADIRGHVRSRFWFVGDERASACTDREGVMVIDNLVVAVETRVAGTTMKQGGNVGQGEDEIGSAFARSLSASYADLAKAYPVLDRARTLFKLVGLATGIRTLSAKYATFRPDLDYWLDGYQVAPFPTPREYPLVEKARTVSRGQEAMHVEVDGGVQLPLMLELRDGSLTALRDIVVACRPKASALSWQVPLREWRKPEDLDADLDALTSDDARLSSSPTGEGPGFSIDGLVYPAGDAGRAKQMLQSAALGDLHLGIPKFSPRDALATATASNIGGVMLSGAAKVAGGGRTEVDLSGGNFSLVVDGKHARISPRAYRKFITALWCVYYGDQEPGISIDPPPRTAGKELTPAEFMQPEKHSVRYIGRVLNTDLGRVMREADYLMKKWAVGSQPADYPGLLSVDGYQNGAASDGKQVGQRFWFVPENLRFTCAGDLLLFDAGRMRVNTEYTTQGMRGKKSPSAEAFADFFTRHYHEIAEKTPIYQELFEYAKLVSLARYLKEQGVPLHWFLMANKDLVLLEDSVREVDALVKRSDHVPGLMIKGGVNLAATPSYNYNAGTAHAIQDAVAQLPSVPLRATASADGRQTRRVPVPFSFNVDKQSYSVLPQHTLSCGKDCRGTRYQTDLALGQNGAPGLELVRYFDPRNRAGGEFGQGWRLLIPYRVKPADDATTTFLAASIPQRMKVVNLLTGREEVLGFSRKDHAAAGYFSDNPQSSPLVGLFLMSDASFRLDDKLGNEFQFDRSGYLTDMVLSPNPNHRLHIEYAGESIAAFPRTPYMVEPADGKRVEFLDALVPERVKVTDLLHNRSEVLCFNGGGPIRGYVPRDPQAARYQVAAVLSDGGLQVVDALGNGIVFDPRWKFSRLSPPRNQRVIRAISMGDQVATFGYGVDASGRVLIADARLSQRGSNAPPTCRIRYEYDEEGRLCRVRRADSASLHTGSYVPRATATDTLSLSMN